MSKPYATYIKAIKGKVSGRTIDKKGNEVEFLLKGDPSDPNVDEFDMIVEVYTDDDDRIFRRINRGAIEGGYILRRVGEAGIEVTGINAVSDGDLKDILKMPYPSMVKRVNQFTSYIPVVRMEAIAREMDKPIKTMEFIQRKIVELHPEHQLPDRIGDQTSSVGI